MPRRADYAATLIYLMPRYAFITLSPISYYATVSLCFTLAADAAAYATSFR